jgi:hypothetical protein
MSTMVTLNFCNDPLVSNASPMTALASPLTPSSLTASEIRTQKGVPTDQDATFPLGIERQLLATDLTW